jgi:hypothetical protein
LCILDKAQALTWLMDGEQIPSQLTASASLLVACSCR